MHEVHKLYFALSKSDVSHFLFFNIFLSISSFELSISFIISEFSEKIFDLIDEVIIVGILVSKPLFEIFGKLVSLFIVEIVGIVILKVGLSFSNSEDLIVWILVSKFVIVIEWITDSIVEDLIESFSVSKSVDKAFE